MTKIAFIGLGHMGAPMVKNLIKNQHEVCVFDLSTAAMEQLAKEGAKPALNLKDAAKQAGVIITMLPTGENVAEVCLKNEGLFESAEKGTLFIDCSSIAVDKARAVNELAVKRGMHMVDAPVSGGVAGAEAGTLTFMVGGSEENFSRAKPILESLGKTIIHAGEAGNGQAAKICNNMILGISMIAVSEAFMLGKKLGLDPQKLFEISSHASGQCWSMTSYCPVPDILPNVPSSRNYEPGFTTAMMLKDLKLSQTAAQQVGAATPLGAEAAMLYTLFNNLGNGQSDFSGIIKMIEGNK